MYQILLCLSKITISVPIKLHMYQIIHPKQICIYFFFFFFSRVFTRALYNIITVYSLSNSGGPDHLTAWPGSDCGSVPCMTLLDCVVPVCVGVGEVLWLCLRWRRFLLKTPPESSFTSYDLWLTGLSTCAVFQTLWGWTGCTLTLSPVFRVSKLLAVRLSLSVVHQSLYVTCYLWLQQSVFNRKKGPFNGSV